MFCHTTGCGDWSHLDPRIGAAFTLFTPRKQNLVFHILQENWISFSIYSPPPKQSMPIWKYISFRFRSRGSCLLLQFCCCQFCPHLKSWQLDFYQMVFYINDTPINKLQTKSYAITKKTQIQPSCHLTWGIIFSIARVLLRFLQLSLLFRITPPPPPPPPHKDWNSCDYRERNNRSK